MKHCCGCDEVRTTVEFSRDRSRPDGLQRYCKSCNAFDASRARSRAKPKEPVAADAVSVEGREVLLAGAHRGMVYAAREQWLRRPAYGDFDDAYQDAAEWVLRNPLTVAKMVADGLRGVTRLKNNIAKFQRGRLETAKTVMVGVEVSTDHRHTSECVDGCMVTGPGQRFGGHRLEEQGRASDRELVFALGLGEVPAEFEPDWF